MKIAIIGAGNMGGAIAKGLTQGSIVKAKDIFVSDISDANLNELKAYNQEINITKDNQEAVNAADIIILAVKPWLAREVLSKMEVADIRVDYRNKILVSIVAGIPLTEYLVTSFSALFRLVPNTAISELASMTLIASLNASEEQQQLILNIFNELGLAMLVPEKHIPATTALTSCGIAYVFKYIQAAMQAGIEMGIYPKDAMKMVAQSVKGAAEIILNNETHPSVEIDKVTTPGGITIKGINELDHAGFTSAIIKAIKKSNE